MPQDLSKLDGVATIAAFKSGAVTPAAYAEALIERAAQNSHLNALQSFAAIALKPSILEAFDASPDAALAGLPVLAKDNINTNTYPTSGGTKSLLRHTPETNAGVVKHIKDAGGFIAAKASMHELAFGITSNNAVTGPVRNPVDPDMIAGASESLV